jgi:putative ABC transport system permease protein
MLNLFRYIGLRHLQLKPGRVLLTVLGVTFGIALFTAIAIINHSTKGALRQSIESISGKAKLTVSAGTAGFAEEKLEIIRTTPGVRYAVPLVEARAFFVGASDSSEGLYILGVDLLQDTSVRSYKTTDEGPGQRIIDDPLTFLNQADSLVITQALAKKRGLKIDSKVNLATANGVKTFTIRGILEPEGAAKAYGGSLAIMDIDGARMTFAKENKLDRVDIVPEKGFETSVVRANLEKSLGTGFLIESPEMQTEQMDKMLDSYQIVLSFFSTLALLVGLFLVMNSISVSIAERRKEIGTLRALGASRTSMVALFISEVFGMGLVGSLLGCGLGRLLAEVLSTQVTNSVAAQFQTRIEITRLEFTPQQFWFSLLIGTFASVIAAALPASKAAQVHPLESMKKHSESLSPTEERRFNLLTWVGLALLLFMSVSMMNEWVRYGLIADMLTKGASVLGSAFFGPFLVFGLIYAARRLSQVGSGLTPVTLRLALENLIRSRKRTSSNVMALLVGLFLVMLIATVQSSFYGTIMNWVDRIFAAEIMISSNGRIVNADVQPLREEIAEEILKIPGVRPVGADRGLANRVVFTKYQGKKIMIKAHDHYADFYQYRAFGIIGADRMKTAKLLYEASSEPRLLVTPGFADQQKKSVGDTITLDTPSGAVDFKIVGIVQDFGSPAGVFYLNRAVYRKYWNDRMVTAFFINVADGFTPEQVRQNIDERLGQKWNLVTMSAFEFRHQMEMAIERTFAYTKAIEFIALLVALLGLLNTLLISVMERTRELGMLRAVGSTQRQVAGMIFNEAVLQGFFGGMIAILLGVFVGRMFVEYTLTINLGWVVDFYLPSQSMLQTLGTGVLVAALAGVLPAIRAAKLNITDALDYE